MGEEFERQCHFPETIRRKNWLVRPLCLNASCMRSGKRNCRSWTTNLQKIASEFDTLDELKKDIRAKLTETAEKNAETAVEEQLVEQIVENMEAEIPQCMVDRKTDEMLQEFDYRLQSQGLNLDLYMKYTGFNPILQRDHKGAGASSGENPFSLGRNR